MSNPVGPVWPSGAGWPQGRPPARAGVRPASPQHPPASGATAPVIHLVRLEGLPTDVPVTLDPERVTRHPPRLTWGVTRDASAVRVVTGREGRGPDHLSPWSDGPATAWVHDGAPLLPREQRWWRIEARTGDAVATHEVRARVGLREDDWSAAWIGLPMPDDGTRPVVEFRRDITVPADAARTLLHGTALGLYRVWVDGQRVDDRELSPGWTDFARRVETRTDDVSEFLRPGRTARITAELAEGWYSGHVGFHQEARRYGSEPALALQFEIEHRSGARTTVGTDATWQARPTDTELADLLLGERHTPHVRRPWRSASVVAAVPGPREVARAAPVRVLQHLPAVAVTEFVPGVWRFDIGQNLAGRARLRIPGASDGERVTFRHGEAVHADGSLYTTNLRAATSRDDLIVHDGVAATAGYTQHGFAHVEVAGLHASPEASDLTAEVLSTDLAPAGGLRIGHEGLQRLHDAIVWSVRANSVDLPTDCPQRDERLGWTNTVADLAPVYTYLFDVEAWFDRWLTALTDTQADDGTLPDVAPLADSPGNQLHIGAPGWADAGVVVPWRCYEAYGDRRVLERHAAMARGWVDRIAAANPSGRWLHHRGADYGDWLGLVPAPSDLVADASWTRTTRLFAAWMARLGDPDAARYAALADHVREAAAREHVRPDGEVTGACASSYALALRWGLVPRAQVAATAALLAAHVEEFGIVTAGYLGAAELLHALSDTGYADIAWRLLLQEDVFGWRYPVEQGSTTLWERFDGWTHELGFHQEWLNSLDHSALGTVATWLHQRIGGLSPLAPGWRRVRVAPLPGGDVPRASTWHRSPHGDITSAWGVEGGRFVLSVTLPVGSTAVVELPYAREVIAPDGATAIATTSDGRSRPTYEVGSGSWSFHQTLGS